MPKEKKTAKVEIRLAPTLAQAAKAKADRIDRPLSDVIREFLQRWVGTKPNAKA